MQLFKLISPVIGAILASLMALSVIALFFTGSLDANSLSAERRFLTSTLEEIPENLKVLAEDNSWWDEAVDNIFLTENMPWIRSTMGGTANGIGDIDGVFVLRADNSVILSTDNRNTPPAIEEFLENGLGRAIDDLKPIDADIGVSTHGYAPSAGRVYALGISMVQPSGFKTFDPPLGTRRRPVVIFYREIDSGQTAALADNGDLQELVFIPENVPAGRISEADRSNGKTFQILRGLNGMPLGRFRWSPSKPGAGLLEQLFWPALFFLFVIGGALAGFIYRAQRLIDELAQADRVKMAFLASMSHEVRTPLNSIIGFAEVLRLELHGKIKGEKNREYLDIIRTSGEHLLTVINDILNISKLDAGKMEVFAEAMNPVEVINQSVHMVETTAHDRSIRLVTELESATIRSDERIVRQILINILSNALKFTAPGGQVSIRSEAIPAGYRIVITDTGVGMSREEIEVAVAPFGQVHNSNRQSGVGTGLGLPLVNRFIKLIGGSMLIRSAPGHGTSVTLEFPEAAPAPSDKASIGETFFR